MQVHDCQGSIKEFCLGGSYQLRMNFKGEVQGPSPGEFGFVRDTIKMHKVQSGEEASPLPTPGENPDYITC